MMTRKEEAKKRTLMDIYEVSRRIAFKLMIKGKFKEAEKYVNICKQVEEWLDDMERSEQA